MTSSSFKNPKLRFPDFKENWVKMRISDVTDRVSLPVDVKTDQIYTQIGVRSHGKGLFHKQPVSGKELGNKRVFWVQENLFVVNIVFAWEQAVAKTTKNEVGTIASHRFPMFRPKADLLNLDFFLFSFLTKRGKSLLDVASPGGAGRNKTLGQEEFNRIKISVPCLEEQKKISAFLLTVNEKIERLAMKKELLVQYKKGVMQQIFDQKIRFKDINGNEFPDWELKKIGDFAEVSAGATPSTLKPEYWEGNILWMNSGELNLKRVYDVENRISQLGLAKSSTRLLPRNCVLIGLAGQGKTRGTVAMNMVELCTNQSIAAIHPNQGAFVEDFLFHNLDNRYDELRGLSTGDGGRGGLNLQIIRAIKVKLPSLPEQRLIADFLSALDQKVMAISRQLKKTKLFKNGFLQQMFV